MRFYPNFIQLFFPKFAFSYCKSQESKASMLLYVSYKNLIFKPFQTFLQILILAFGTGLIFLLILAERQIKEQFSQNIKGIDLVVGAKGSPLQLILANVYHLDNPTGNIAFEEYNKLRKNFLVKSTIPLAYGDSFESFRILGTDTSYLVHYEALIKEGVFWKNDFEVTLGATVAQKLGLKIGDTFQSDHGLVENDHKHTQKYKVVGILERNGKVLDKLILTSIPSVWKIHEEHPENEPDSTEAESPKEITAILVKFRNPMAVVMLPRQINSQTQMQAASPAYEITRLFELLGIGIDTLTWIAWFLIAISALSIWANLYQSLQERRYEVALIRTFGASKIQIFRVFIQESLLLVIFGLFVGFLLSRLVFLFLQNALNEPLFLAISWALPTETDFYLVLASLILGFLAGFVPAYRASKMLIAKVLAS